jgi:intracellular sulfur oxidation DsrE/DsrF family protein
MKRIILVSIFIVVSQFVWSQSMPYRVVFDITSGDTTDHQSLIRWINGIHNSDSTAKLEVVFYGQSLNMVLKDESVVQNDIRELIEKKAVSLKVCGAAMKRHHINKNQLLPGVEIVPDGIYEITTKQHEGWGYIKVSH